MAAIRNLDGCEAVSLTGHNPFIKKPICNKCMIEYMSDHFGSVEIVDDPNGGVEVRVWDWPELWLPEEPTHCTCNVTSRR